MAFTFVDSGTGTLGGTVAHDRNASGRFSDGTLYIVAIDTTGTRKLVLWVSFDGGASWAQSASGDILSPLDSGTGSFTTQGIGSDIDTLYISIVNAGVSNDEHRFVRLVWSAATKTFTTPVLNTLIISFAAAFPYREGSFSREPGGRLWCLSRDLTVGFIRYIALFSNDGGVTWAKGNLGSDLDSSNASASEGFIFSFEFKTVVGYCDNTSGRAFKTRDRLHTDADTAAWTAKVDRDTFVPIFGGTVLAASPAAPVGGNIKEACWVYGVREQTPNSQFIRLTKVNEDGAGNLSFTSHAVYTYSAFFGGGNAFANVTGYDDGFRVYLYDPSLNLTDVRIFTTPKLHTSGVTAETVEVLPFTNTGEANLGDPLHLHGSTLASLERLLISFDGVAPFKIGVENFASVALPGVGDDGRRRWSHLSRASWRRMGRTRR